jgi:hypothetical protein
MSINTVDALYGELDFSQEKMLEHEQRIENLEIALKRTLQILKYLVDSETKNQEQPNDVKQKSKN